MLRYTNTTVFNVGAQTIVNTVNCVGVMGAGLALEFQLRFPEMERDYVERCSQRRVEVGRPYLYKGYSNPWILNFPTKDHWKYPSKIEWLEDGLRYFATNYQRGGITSIAFPKLGCSNGGLEWGVVSSLMEKYLRDLAIDVFICEDTERVASGLEGVMVQTLNAIEKLDWAEKLGIRADIKRKIISATPINRFRDLRRVTGIGKQTYNDVFSFLYSLASRGVNTESTQELEVEVGESGLLKEFESSSTQFEKQVKSSPKGWELGETEKSAGLSLNLTDLSRSEELKNRRDELAECDDAFHIMMPHIEKSLAVGQTKNELANRFKLPKKLLGDWLEEAERTGRIKKISRRPVKYIATSSTFAEQLECSFNL